LDFGEALAVSACNRLAAIIETIREFIAKQWLTNGGIRSEDIFERDARFITFAAEKAAECSEEAIRNLQEEMRGLSHYFGSYCDQHRLEALLDAMFEETQTALIANRGQLR
jgi:hypothetical protein